MEETREIRLGRAWLLGASVVLAALVLAGCAGSAKSAGGTVDVSLQEWAVVPAKASANAGTVTFNVKNIGPDDPHEMVVVKTDLAAGKLPTDADGKVDEKAAGLEVIGEVEELDPGKTATASFDLKAGNYVLICNILQDEPDGSKEAHYKMGMFIPFVVN